MRPRDERLLIDLWALMWREEFSHVAARRSSPGDRMLLDMGSGWRNRIRSRLVQGDFEGEDNAMLRRQVSGREPMIEVDVRWIELPQGERLRAGLPFVDVCLRCPALQHRPWHLRQPWQASAADRDDAVAFSTYVQRQVGGPFPDVESEQELFVSRRHREMQADLERLGEEHARALFDGRPSPYAQQIDYLHRLIAAEIQMSPGLLGVDRSYQSQYQQRWTDHPSASMRPSHADRSAEREFAMRMLLAEYDPGAFVGVMLDDPAPVADSRCRSCRESIPNSFGVNSLCVRCVGAKTAVNLLANIVDAILTACAVAFATSIQSLSQLVAPVCGVRMDGLYSYVTISVAGFSARRVGRCSRHGYFVGAGSAELHCVRCHADAEARRLAMALLRCVLDVSLTAWWESLSHWTRRCMLLELAPTTSVHVEPADLHSERYGMIELGDPEPYVAPADNPLPERPSAVDEAHGVQELLLEMS